MNMKNLHETHECSICMKEYETQEHIYSCSEIWSKMGKTKANILKYEKIMNGNRQEKVQVAKVFKENLKFLENMKQNIN